MIWLYNQNRFRPTASTANLELLFVMTHLKSKAQFVLDKSALDPTQGCFLIAVILKGLYRVVLLRCRAVRALGKAGRSIDWRSRRCLCCMIMRLGRDLSYLFENTAGTNGDVNGGGNEVTGKICWPFRVHFTLSYQCSCGCPVIWKPVLPLIVIRTSDAPLGRKCSHIPFIGSMCFRCLWRLWWGIYNGSEWGKCVQKCDAYKSTFIN